MALPRRPNPGPAPPAPAPACAPAPSASPSTDDAQRNARQEPAGLSACHPEMVHGCLSAALACYYYAQKPARGGAGLPLASGDTQSHLGVVPGGLEAAQVGPAAVPQPAHQRALDVRVATHGFQHLPAAAGMANAEGRSGGGRGVGVEVSRCGQEGAGGGGRMVCVFVRARVCAVRVRQRENVCGAPLDGMQGALEPFMVMGEWVR